jgi:TPR repeat protein
VKKNVEEAMNHFHHAADYGNLESIHQLIEIYSNSSTPEFNIDKTKFYLEPLLDNNDPYALYTAGRLTLDGIIYPHNTKEGLKYLRRAKIGSSYYLLGKTYQDGIHVNQDFSMALIYYFKGIEMGDVDCMINTVDLIINYKIDIDFLSILKIAYELGNPRAASLLGKCYLFGISVRKNRKKALALFTEAAANSDSLGYRYLGYCYIKGMGTEVDFTRGVYNYEIAAGLGDIEAALFLGTIANSADDQKNIDLAKQYFTLAANAGSSYGYYELALIYIDEDFDLSIEYLNKAINLGNDLAVKKYLEIKEK